MSLLTLVQIRRTKTKVKAKMKNLFKRPMKASLNQQGQGYSKYFKFRLSRRFNFHLHFIHLAKIVGCVNYAQNTGRFKAVKLHQHPNLLFSKHADSLKRKAAEKKIQIQAMIAKWASTKKKPGQEKKEDQTRRVNKYFLKRPIL